MAIFGIEKGVDEWRHAKSRMTRQCAKLWVPSEKRVEKYVKKSFSWPLLGQFKLCCRPGYTTPY